VARLLETTFKALGIQRPQGKATQLRACRSAGMAMLLDLRT